MNSLERGKMKRKEVILVVNDEEETLSLFQKILKEEGYTAFIANNGKKALDLARKKKVNLVILDLKLPDIDGIEILRQIKKIDKSIEVIIVTGYGAMKTAKTAMKLGAYEYITKPLNLDFIKAAIRNALTETEGAA